MAGDIILRSPSTTRFECTVYWSNFHCLQVFGALAPRRSTWLLLGHQSSLVGPLENLFQKTLLGVWCRASVKFWISHLVVLLYTNITVLSTLFPPGPLNNWFSQIIILISTREGELWSETTVEFTSEVAGDGVGLLSQVWLQILIGGLIESKISLPPSVLDNRSYCDLSIYDTNIIYLDILLDLFLVHRSIDHSLISHLHKDFFQGDLQLVELMESISQWNHNNIPSNKKIMTCSRIRIYGS